MQSSDIMEIFSENVRRHLKLRGATIQWLATASGIARPNLSRILHGKENVSLERAEVIARALQVSLSEMVTPPRSLVASA